MILSESVVGIDVGLKEFYSDSKGAVVNKPKYLEKNAKKLAREQRRLARKQKGSHNREKQRVKVAAAHEKIANQRNDFLQKQSTMLVREFAQIPWQEDIRRASRSVTQKGKP